MEEELKSFVKVGISVPAVLVTFFVSGLMHELIYYHATHLPPTWEATCYFVMHGTCLDVEIVMKKKKAYIEYFIAMNFAKGVLHIH
ncbi:hypothetical protein SLA2020_124270 [Shorea laevis]